MLLLVLQQLIQLKL